MNALDHLAALRQTRRQFFGRAAGGIGLAALSSLLNPNLFAKSGDPVSYTHLTLPTILRV